MENKITHIDELDKIAEATLDQVIDLIIAMPGFSERDQALIFDRLGADLQGMVRHMNYDRVYKLAPSFSEEEKETITNATH